MATGTREYAIQHQRLSRRQYGWPVSSNLASTMTTTGKRSHLLCIDSCINASTTSTNASIPDAQICPCDYLSCAAKSQIRWALKSSVTNSSLKRLPSTRTRSATPVPNSRLYASSPVDSSGPEGSPKRTTIRSSPRPLCTVANCSRSLTSAVPCTWQVISGGQSRIPSGARKTRRP